MKKSLTNNQVPGLVHLTVNLRRYSMQRLVIMLMLLIPAMGSMAQTPVPMASQPGLTYTENFADIANWTNGFASGIGANRFSSVAVNAGGTIPAPTTITTSSATFTSSSSGGVQRGTGNIMLLSTNSTDNTTSVAFDLHLDFTGLNASTISFDAATVFNSTGNRKGTLRVYATVDNINWVELTTTNLPYIATNNVAGSASISNLALPASFNGSATARLRFYYHNGTGGTTGSRPKISIDNLTITAINPNIVPVVTSNTATATVGVPFSYYITATGGPTSYNATGLPPGLNVNTGTGQIYGTPQNAGIGFGIGLEATNGVGTGTGTLTLDINPGSQSITFNPLTPVTYGTLPFTLNATGGASGNPVTYISSNPFVATVSGNVVTITGGGSADITASQAGNSDYNPAPDVTRTLVVNPASQTITFGPLAPVYTTDPPFNLNATGGNSGNPVTYFSSNTNVATILGNTVTIVGAGTTVITASQAGNANYLAAPDVNQTLLVNIAGLIPQVITFNALPAATYGDAPITLTATGGASGNPVTYTSSNTNVATISGDTLTILTPGSTVITASQVGNAQYESAVDVTQTLVVNPKSLTVPSATADDKVYDGNTNAVLSNLALAGVVSGDVVAVTGGGNFATANAGTGISVTASLSLFGIDSFKYTLTQPTGLTANITPAPQVINFTAIPAKTYASAPFTLVATGGASGNPITFVSDNASVVIVSGNTCTVTGVGTANITASQAGNNNYQAATDVINPVVVGLANQTITFNTLASHVVGEPPFALTATTPSGLPITFTSSDTTVATVSGNIVTILAPGSTDITASQGGNANWNPAPNVTRTLVITYPLVAAWDFFGQSSPVTFAATTFDANLVSAGGGNLVSRGPGATANTAGNSFRTTGFQNNGISVSNTDYFQTRLQAKPGYSLTLSSINAVFAGTASFAAAPGVTSQFAYSLDGTNFTLINSPFVTVGSPATSPIVNLTGITALQNLHSSQQVTIRYYASGQTATGGWGFTSPSAGVNGLAYGGSLTICAPSSSTSSMTVCQNNLPYSWNGQSINASGTYTYTTINSLGCDSSAELVLTVDPCPTNTTLQLTCFIQALWDGTSALTPALYNQGQVNPLSDCDTIHVELRAASAPATIVDSVNTILHTNGSATCIFPTAVPAGYYYIVVKHRNTIETWSADSVQVNSSSFSYNFSTAASQAYGSNQIELTAASLPIGIFAMYSGDVVKDSGEATDLLDLNQLEAEINNFSYGYFAEDLNGDGNVDILDAPALESNISNFIYSSHP